MKRFGLIVLGGFVLLFFIAAMASAQGPDFRGMHGQGGSRWGCQQRFDALDTNHDGKLTKEEFMAAPHCWNNPEQVFAAMDVNGRGYITKEEFCSGRGMSGRGRGRGMCGCWSQGRNAGTDL
ncbi:MAG: EF-hand domain-containing protein [Syntrophobacteraceae bacterium]